MDFLEKLQRAKELIESYADAASNGLEYAADVLHQVEQGLRDAAAFLDKPLMGSDGEDIVDKLEDCKVAVPKRGKKAVAATKGKKASATTPVGAIPPWLIPVLAEVLNRAIDALIERLRDRRKAA